MTSDADATNVNGLYVPKIHLTGNTTGAKRKETCSCLALWNNQFCLKLFSSITADQIAESLAMVSCMVAESV